MTNKLYYENSYLAEFSAKVLSCEAVQNGYAIVLDRTAFFPEGGGQPADIGEIRAELENTNVSTTVFDVHEKDGIIYHYANAPLTVNSNAFGKIDFERRIRLMQNHGGEHIVSWAVNCNYKLNNVGFHMGSEDITIDYDGFLDRNALRDIEKEVNLTVRKNLPIRTYYPTPDELSNLKYRSKRAIDGAVRIVEIEDCDRCACCAPHLAHTGEIGIVKILDSYKYKGGVRVHLQCGMDALDDYNQKYDAVREIANELSVSQKDVASAFLHLKNDFSECRATVSRLKTELMELKVRALKPAERNIFIYEAALSGDDIRRLASMAAEKCGGMCAVFSGDEEQLNYCIVSKSIALRVKIKEINNAINGRGGGTDEMLQGRAFCSLKTAETFFKTV